MRVGTVELIRFADFGSGDGDGGGMMHGMGEALDGVCKLCHRVLRDLLVCKVWVVILESRLLEESPPSELGAPGV